MKPKMIKGIDCTNGWSLKALLHTNSLGIYGRTLIKDSFESLWIFLRLGCHVKVIKSTKLEGKYLITCDKVPVKCLANCGRILITGADGRLANLE